MLVLTWCIYASSCIGTCLLVSVLIMLGIIVSLHNAQDKRNVAENVVFRQTLIAITTFVSYIIITIMVGARANNAYKLHSASIMQHILLTDKRIISIKIKMKDLEIRLLRDEKQNELIKREMLEAEFELHQYSQVFDALNTVKAAVQLSTDLQPIRILQMEASYTLAYTILTTLISFCIFIFASVR